MSILYFGPIMLFRLRMSRFWNIARSNFYMAVAVVMLSLSLLALVLWGIWLVFTDYCEAPLEYWSEGTRRQLAQDTPEIYRYAYAKRPLSYERDCAGGKASEEAKEQLDIKKTCDRIATLQQHVWGAPLTAIIWNFVVASFCLLQARLDLDKDSDVIKLVRQFLSMVMFSTVGIYASVSYINGTATGLAQSLLVFLVVMLIGLLIFIRCEVRPKVLHRLSTTSVLAKYASKAYGSDLAKALTVFVWGSCVPLFLLLDLVRQCARKARGTATITGHLTELGEKVVAEMRKWNWNGVFCLVCTIGAICVMLILGSKCTFVFFAWLNAALRHVEMGPVVTIAFSVGIVMFMLPPVPGSAVYVFTGIVVGSHAGRSLGLLVAVTLASLVALAAKLAGSAGQYMIGHFLGKDVRVQKLIGVDTAPTRAVELILKTRGWTMGKVAILVGGPDWPTSVTCGILQMNLPQMLLGTLPVYPVSVFPQTLVGALLTHDSDDPNLRTLSTMSTAGAAFAQAAASLIATYKITQMLETHGQQLAEPRIEHQQVAELSRRRAQHNQALKAVCQWNGPYMTLRRKVTICFATALVLICGIVLALDFVAARSFCLRDFAMTGDINASFQDGGLEGNVLNVILFPLGAVNLGLLTVALAVFGFHTWESRRLSKTLVTLPILE